MNLTRLEDDHDKRKLIKLHWREAQVPITIVPVSRYAPPQEETIWSSLNGVDIDKEKLAHLFELKQAEIKTKVSFLLYNFERS